MNFCDRNCEADSKDTNADDGYAVTAPVGSYLAGASPYEALDMAGNVVEWVANWYAEDYYARSPYRNPRGPRSGESRVVRGGAFLDEDSWVRCAYRFDSGPDAWYGWVGFRIVVPVASGP